MENQNCVSSSILPSLLKNHRYLLFSFVLHHPPLQSPPELIWIAFLTIDLTAWPTASVERGADPVWYLVCWRVSLVSLWMAAERALMKEWLKICWTCWQWVEPIAPSECWAGALYNSLKIKHFLRAERSFNPRNHNFCLYWQSKTSCTSSLP